jgi:hypothetical protein
MPLNLHAGLDNRFLVRTEAGAKELRERTLGLPQKVRTLLLLADGKRTVGEVRKLTAAAGAGPESLQQLLDMGLLHLAQAPVLGSPDFTHSVPITLSPAVSQNSADAEATPAVSTAATEHAPAAVPAPAPALTQAPAPFSWPSAAPKSVSAHALAAPEIEPAVLAVRSHLSQALPALMPGQSAALIFRLGRCTTREDIQTLLQEVEDKLAQPAARASEVSAMVRHARALLAPEK